MLWSTSLISISVNNHPKHWGCCGEQRHETWNQKTRWNPQHWWFAAVSAFLIGMFLFSFQPFSLFLAGGIHVGSRWSWLPRPCLGSFEIWRGNTCAAAKRLPHVVKRDVFWSGFFGVPWVFRCNWYPVDILSLTNHKLSFMFIFISHFRVHQSFFVVITIVIIIIMNCSAFTIHHTLFYQHSSLVPSWSSSSWSARDEAVGQRHGPQLSDFSRW